MAMSAMAIGAVAAPVVGGIVGNLMGAGDKKRAQAAIQAALQQYANINIPDTEKMRLALESPEVQGIIQPYMQQAEELGMTSMTDVAIDPRLKQAQMTALDTLSRMGETGLTPVDRAALNQARREVAGDEQSRQASILSQMAQRGISGSGMELAAKLASSQGSADRASQEGDRLMAMAQERMLAATANAGNLGGQIREQDYGEQTDLARAKDAIAQFNAAQRTNVNTTNIGNMNNAQADNLANKQRVADAGVTTRNAQQEANKALLQQEFDNKMGLASARANAYTGQANMYNSAAKDKASMYQGIGSGIGTGLMAASQYKPKAASTPTATAPDGAAWGTLVKPKLLGED